MKKGEDVSVKFSEYNRYLGRKESRELLNCFVFCGNYVRGGFFCFFIMWLYFSEWFLYFCVYILFFRIFYFLIIVFIIIVLVY